MWSSPHSIGPMSTIARPRAGWSASFDRRVRRALRPAGTTLAPEFR
jgi:hypothetical protein